MRQWGKRSRDRSIISTSCGIFACIFVLVVADIASAYIIHVSPTGSDSKNGISWPNSKLTIGAAMSAAVGGDEIWVRAGTYREVVTLKSGVGLYGGFSGIETTRSQRNWVRNVTILDGKSVSGKYIGDSVVITPLPAVSSITISGFTITNGNKYGICCNMGSNLTISNNRIALNTGNYSAGIYVYYTSYPLIHDNLIYSNSYGILINGGGGSIINNTICNNTSGGICANSGGTIIANNIIVSNTGYGISNQGSTTLDHNCVWGNTPGDYNGVTPDSESISADPLFVNSSSRDYHLQFISPCWDVGDNQVIQSGFTDADGQARISNRTVDMGAYELPLSCISITSQPSDQNVSLGTRATFSAITQKDPTLTYQWQVNKSGVWVNVTTNDGVGGLTSIFRTVPVTYDMYFFHYRCLIRNSKCATRTSAAALTCALTIVVDAGVSNGSQISPMLLGNNIDVVGNVQGLWDTSVYGFNSEGRNRANRLAPKLMRFPGGAVCEYYHWSRAIGPQYNRITYGDAYDYDMVSFGTDEFMKFCTQIGCTDQMMVVNIGALGGVWAPSGTPQEAAAWVAYCNGNLTDSNSIGIDVNGANWYTVGYWASLRAQNGHPPPYNVKYWEVGNEPYWLNIIPSVYGKKVLSYAQAMKTVDPTILVGASVPTIDVTLANSNVRWSTSDMLTSSMDMRSAPYKTCIDFFDPHYFATLDTNLPYMVFYTNGAFSRDFSMDSSGNYTVDVKAKAKPDGKTWATMVVTIDPKGTPKKRTFNVNTESYQDYSFAAQLGAGTHTLQIEFTNDVFYNDLYIQGATVNGLEVWYPEEEAKRGILAGDDVRIDNEIGDLRNIWSSYQQRTGDNRYPKIIVGEGGLWFDAQEAFAVQGGLFAGSMLNRAANEKLDGYCPWWLLDSIGYNPSDDSLTDNAVYQVLGLYADKLGRTLMPSSVTCPTIPTYSMKSTLLDSMAPAISAMATSDPNRICLFVVNWSQSPVPTSAVLMNLGFTPVSYTATALGGSSLIDQSATVSYPPVSATGEGLSVILPGYSVCAIEVQGH